ncbi:undecaprenyl-diphosphatase UppP [Fimbriiglobus ruber]|uniref:Undecaprenyl-diphosphatase n=1 Tax=Fimbriiglobus ruber TaxID=1908690 RepID=A0A225E4K5_9BACT|nr:undecaprenyl-diphosphatase UppP [Fimbriiglobus ruber]OWK44419.1 Undecaprenyl-diphosphatase [Fimbriiglobus ruber]
MPIWEAILLGIVQGLTEFLPISSTAHLLLVRQLLGHKTPEDAFTTVIQLGTLFAVLWYFRADILHLTRAVLRDFATFRFASTPDSRMAWLIVLGTVPVVVVGMVAKKWLKGTFYDLPTMALVAIIFALLMAAAEIWVRVRRDRGLVPIEENRIGWKEALWVGCWQVLALMPGASRSGTTITGGLFAGLDRRAAARFSFLLSLPAVFGAGVKEMYDEYKLLKHPDGPQGLFASGDDLIALAVGLVVSGVVGYVSIAWLLGFLRRYSMAVFVVYRLVLGLTILALLAAGVVKG